MTKAELVKEVAQAADLTKKHSEVIVNVVFESIIEGGGRVMGLCVKGGSEGISRGNIKKLEDVDLDVLRTLIERSVAARRAESAQ